MGESLLGVLILAPCFSDDCILILGVVSERCIEVLVFYHSLCCRCFTIIIKQGLFLLGDMAILNTNITIIQIFLFDELSPVYLVTDYFIGFMFDFGGQS